MAKGSDPTRIAVIRISPPNRASLVLSRAREHALPLALLAALALVVYAPWSAPPLDALDLSEALPFYRSQSGFFARTAALTNHYAVNWGRLNPVLIAWYAGQWSLFGASPLGWQIVAFCLMLANTFGVYALLRRLGFVLPAAAGGATVVVLGTAAADPWFRGWYYGEPLVLALVVLASYLAAGAATSTRPLRRAIGIALCLAAATYTKEVAVACIPFVAAIAVTFSPTTGWHVRLPRRAEWRAAAAAAALLAVASVPLLLVRVAAPAESYGAKYSLSAIQPGVATLLTGSMFLPFFNPEGAPLVRPAEAAVIVVLITGVGLALRRDRRLWIPLACALLLSVCGAIIYLPWYYFRPDYALPYVLGPAVFVAISVLGVSRVGWKLAYLAGVVALVVGLGTARTVASRRARTLAMRAAAGELRARVARAVARGSHRVLYAIDADERQAWLAIRERRVAEATVAPRVLATAQLACADAVDSLQNGDHTSLVVTLPDNCRDTRWPRVPDEGVTARFQYISLRKGRVVEDSILVRIWLESR